MANYISREDVGASLIRLKNWKNPCVVWNNLVKMDENGENICTSGIAKIQTKIHFTFDTNGFNGTERKEKVQFDKTREVKEVEIMNWVLPLGYMLLALLVFSCGFWVSRCIFEKRPTTQTRIVCVAMELLPTNKSLYEQ